MKEPNQRQILQLHRAQQIHSLEIRRSSRDVYLWMKRLAQITQVPDYRPSYLHFKTTIQQQQRIMESLVAEIPSKLPPLSLLTISYYRRSNRPIFYGQPDQHPHIICQSLMMLATIQNSQYDDIQDIVNCFEKNLQYYLASQWWEIRELAIMVAGNKYFGKPQHIIKLIDEPRYLWVIFNHIQEGQFGFECLVPKIMAGNEECLQCLCQIMHYQQRLKEVFVYLLENDKLLHHFVSRIQPTSPPTVYRRCVEIIAHLLSSSDQDLIQRLLQKGIIFEAIYKSLFLPNQQTKKLGCWAISNLSRHSPTWNRNIFECEQVMSRLIEMLYGDTIAVKQQILRLLMDLMSEQNLGIQKISEFIKNNKLMAIISELCQDQDLPELQLAAFTMLSYVFEFESAQHQLTFKMEVKSRGILLSMEKLSFNEKITEESSKVIEGSIRKLEPQQQ